jgi:hypothetical protein
MMITPAFALFRYANIFQRREAELFSKSPNSTEKVLNESEGFLVAFRVIAIGEAELEIVRCKVRMMEASQFLGCVAGVELFLSLGCRLCFFTPLSGAFINRENVRIEVFSAYVIFLPVYRL